uniref:Odorant receptor n=1 Tax=Protaetia brevitarsis TaxID=348688 RepID=A0A411HR92_PROBE|nr:odorant receptor [Protaetia brevitarsis]
MILKNTRNPVLKLGLGLLKAEEDILEDDVKYTMAISKIVLSTVHLWPENNNVYTKLSFYMIFFVYASIELSLLVHIFVAVKDVVALTDTMLMLSVGVQTLIKTAILYLKSEDLNKMIQSIRKEFWPSNSFGADVKIRIKSETRKLLYLCLTSYLGGLCFLLQFILRPVVEATRVLPYNSWYPFNWSKTPIYEILYILQGYMAIIVNLNIVCGTDFLYYFICANCTAQFRLLCKAMEEIGRENVYSHILLKTVGVTYSVISNEKSENERRLLVLCIQHHQKLLDISFRLNQLFSYVNLCQLAASVAGICAACYLVTSDSKASASSSAPYFIGHIAQLLLYCAVSNELGHWSQQLSIEAFKSGWYLQKCTDIRQCLSILMMRSQEGISMTALGLFELSYASFLTVVRFSFSLYTFLDKFKET